MCVAIGFTSLPIGYLLKLIPLSFAQLGDVKPGRVAHVVANEVADLHAQHERAQAPENTPDHTLGGGGGSAAGSPGGASSSARARRSSRK